MLISVLLLIICFILFRYSVAWIEYYNKIDERMPKSIWRYTSDYPVIGDRDVSDLDDKPLVRQRRKRNTVVTRMYFNVILAFIFINYIVAKYRELIIK